MPPSTRRRMIFLNKDPKERYTYADNQVNIMSIV